MLIQEVDLQKSWVPSTYGTHTKEAPEFMVSTLIFTDEVNVKRVANSNARLPNGQNATQGHRKRGAI